MQLPIASIRRGLIAVFLCGAVCPAGGCNSPESPSATLTRLMEARRLTASLRLLVNKAADAEKRAVMSESDEGSKAFAGESAAASRVALQQASALKSLLEGLEYVDEQRLLSEFDGAFAKFRSLDEKLLELAVENTNLKAQRLSFGEAATAAGVVRRTLEAAVASVPEAGREHAELVAAKIELAVDGMRMLEGPHIAEADDTGMAELETRMKN